MKYVAPKGISSHPSVESCEYGPASGVEDYRHAVALKEGWAFNSGRMQGCRTGHFNSVADFIDAEPKKLPSATGLTIRVNLSKFHREELRHKLDIMEEGFLDDGTADPDFAASSYGFTHIDELSAFRAKLPHDGRSVSIEMDAREAKTAWAELENARDIALDNSGPGSWDEDGEHASAAKRLKVAMDRIEDAAKSAGFDATEMGA